MADPVAQKARIFGLDVISNVIASRDALQDQAQKYKPDYTRVFCKARAKRVKKLLIVVQ